MVDRPKSLCQGDIPASKPNGTKRKSKTEIHPYAKTIKEKTFDGKPIKLTVIHHDDAFCKEFVVSCPGFSLSKWILLTSVFNIIGYLLQLHTQDERIMIAMILLLIILLAVKLNYKVKNESLLVIDTLGVQHNTLFASGRCTKKFYDIDEIKGIVINEGVTMWKVIFYLCLLLKDKDNKKPAKLVPLFKHSWPRLQCLKNIYQQSTEILFSHHCS